MDQKIFDLNLSVEATSLYLLACGLMDADKRLSLANLKEYWNSTPQKLEEAIDELGRLKILELRVSDGKGQTIYRVTDSDSWQKA
jgi:hypothetical protein